MTADEVRGVLVAAIEKAGGASNWAKSAHVSPAYVGDILKGFREPGPAILNALGIERVMMYRRKK